MEDHWKKILKANKQHIQPEFELPEGHEKRFLARLNANKQAKPPVNYWRIAAVFIPLFLLSIYYWLEIRPEKTTKHAVELADYSLELNEASDHLSFIVEQKSERLMDLMESNNQGMIDDSFKKLTALQTEHQEILKDLQESGGNPQVIQSILLNLQLQIEILQQTLDNISHHEEINSHPNESL